MAIILSAECRLFECGTCGEQLLVGASDANRWGRENQSDPEVSAWVVRHREGCPSRTIVAPTLRSDEQRAENAPGGKAVA